MRFSMTTCALLIICVMTTHADESEAVKYVGSASCATFGCHGNTATRSPDLWKSSFILWSRSDPHAKAFEILFTDRSAKMVELLTPTIVADKREGEAREGQAREGEAPAEPREGRRDGEKEGRREEGTSRKRDIGNAISPSHHLTVSPSLGPSIRLGHGSAGALLSRNPNMSDAEYETKYWSVLEERCIGCHATVAATDMVEPSSTIRQDVESLRQGVGCESCHGAAGTWLTEHTTSRWADYSPEEKANRWGLINTRDLAERAALCVDCHVGPRASQTGRVYDVTHELIAAGHPRLTFEFSAYLANLPPHWDEVQDKTRHGVASFHFDAWRVGQFQMARKLAGQLELRNSPTNHNDTHVEWPEFANYDCFACHHRLRADRSSTTRGLPQPADWPLAHLQAMVTSADKKSIRDLYQPLVDARATLVFGFGESPANRKQTIAELRNAIAASAQSVLDEKLSRDARVALLQNLLAQITSQRAASWDSIAQFQLALAAFVEDYDPGDTKRTGIAHRGQQLATYLNSQFGTSRPVSTFDSPEHFASMDEELLTQLQAISVELKAVH